MQGETTETEEILDAILSRLPRYLFQGSAGWLAYKAWQFRTSNESAAVVAVGLGLVMLGFWAILFYVDVIRPSRDSQASGGGRR